MKLGNPVLITSQPLNAPIAMHTEKVTMIASHTGQPKLTDSSAIIIPEKPIIEPTDRSNSPAIIRRPAPTAIMMN